MSPVWYHQLTLVATVASGHPSSPRHDVRPLGADHDLAIGAGRHLAGTSSSKMRTSKYSSFSTPAAFGRLTCRGLPRDRGSPRVTPYAPLNVVTPKRSVMIRSTSTGIGAAPSRR